MGVISMGTDPFTISPAFCAKTPDSPSVCSLEGTLSWRVIYPIRTIILIPMSPIIGTRIRVTSMRPIYRWCCKFRKIGNYCFQKRSCVRFLVVEVRLHGNNGGVYCLDPLVWVLQDLAFIVCHGDEESRRELKAIFHVAALPFQNCLLK